MYISTDSVNSMAPDMWQAITRSIDGQYIGRHIAPHCYNVFKQFPAFSDRLCNTFFRNSSYLNGAASIWCMNIGPLAMNKLI